MSSEKETERQELATVLRQLLQEFAVLDVAGIARTEELGAALDFRDAISDLKMVSDIARRIFEMPVDALPTRLIRDGLTAFQRVYIPIQRIQQFKIKSDHGTDWLAHRNRLLAELADSISEFSHQIAPVLSFAMALMDFHAPIAELHQRGVHLVAEQRASLDRLLQQQDELSEVLRTAREAAQEIGLAQHAAHFKSEADLAERAAKRWLFGTLVTVLGTAAGVGANLVWTYHHPSGSGVDILSLGLAKLIGFSLLFGATIWCARIYRANRHNVIINRHRQNALSSFEAFAAATGDEQTKNAVLLQATHSIFTPQHSGFVDSDAEASINPQIVEVFRGFGQPSK